MSDDVLERAREAFAELVRRAVPVVATLPGSADAVAALEPAADDYAAVFTADVADQVRDAYQALWSQSPPAVEARADQNMIDVYPAPAEAFARDGLMTRAFPTGYRGCAPYLVPGVTWLRWRYRRPDRDAGMAYDGLVSLGQRWVWFPKPYRVLRDLVLH